jgi:anti-sigma B factor antagonist
VSVPKPSNARPSPGELEIETHVSGHCYTLCLTGELDLASTPKLQAAIDRVLPEAHEVVFDIQELTFIDSTGLRCLLACQTSCQQTGTALLMTTGKAQARRLFEITGLLERLPLTDEETVCS